MKILQVQELKTIDRLIYWITERHRIYELKLQGEPKPWTDDRIFQTCYFTNPYRENDKVTKWFREKVRDPLKLSTAALFATVCFRWFNYIPTGELLRSDEMDPAEMNGNMFEEWDLGSAILRLNTVKDVGCQVFTGAFNISAGGSKEPKVERVCRDYVQPVWEDRVKLAEEIIEGRSLAHAHKLLSSYPGMGGSGFMAAQVVADLKYTKLLPQTKVKDWWTWCSPGPGSMRGLCRILNVTERKFNQKDFIEHIVHLLHDLNFALKKMPRFHAQDMQNCLCEFDKYERVLWGEGKSKRTYQGV